MVSGSPEACGDPGVDPLLVLRLTEVRPGEVRETVEFIATPLVPGLSTLHKLSDVIVVCHASSSTRPPTAR